jgi:hypothetical protein
MRAQFILLGVAGVFLLMTALDWRKDPAGGLTPKRRAWLIIAAVFGGISLSQLGLF